MLASISRGLRVLHSKAGSSLKDAAHVQGMLVSSIRNSSSQSKPSEGPDETKTPETSKPVMDKVEFEEFPMDVSTDTDNSVDHPVLIPATTPRAIVGCRCKEFSKTINWFYLDEGDPQLCDCGIYFKLDKVNEDAPVPNIYKVMSVNQSVIDSCPRNRAKRAFELRANK